MSGGRFRAPDLWAEREFGEASLGDQRRTRRAVRLAAAMARCPDGSIPTQAGDWAATKASYRLFDSGEVTHETLIAPHLSQTLESANHRSTVLMIQDTSELDFSKHRSIPDLGPIGRRYSRGFMLHSTLAVDPTGEGDVLGLACQMLFCRQGIQSKMTKAQRKNRPRESQIWCRSVEAAGSPASDSRWIHVCDRYGDFFELFDACRHSSCDLLVRMAQDRRCSPGHDDNAGQDNQVADARLMQWARSLPACGESTMSLRSRPKRKARDAKLLLAYAPVSVFEPRLGRCGAAPIRGWVVRVWEPDTPPSESSIEWVLLTTVPVSSVEDAKRILHWYSLRWLIEEYHKCLKSGCAAEARQMETRGRLEACIGILAVLAVRLLSLKLAARRSPKAKAASHISDQHIRVLGAIRGRPMESITMYDFWREVAKLGGFLARKRDGEPGWQTLWRGWQRLDTMTVGASLEIQKPTSYG